MLPMQPEKTETEMDAEEKATVTFPPRCPNICFLAREVLERRTEGKIIGFCYINKRETDFTVCLGVGGVIFFLGPLIFLINEKI